MKTALLTLCVFVLFGIEKSIGHNPVAVKISILEYLDGTHPTANLTAEFYLGKNFSIQPGIGICLPRNYYNGLHEEGLKGRLELKKYWSWTRTKYNVMTGPYFSVDIFMADFILDKIVTEEKWVEGPDSTQYSDDTNILIHHAYKQYIKTFRTHFKLGIQKNYGKHFVMDSYVGVGAKYKDIHQSQPDRFGDDLGWAFHSGSYETGWYPDITIGIRIGYLF